MNIITEKILRIGHLSTAYHTNFILMADDNLAKDLGMKLDWSLFGTGPLMVKAFSQKKLDMGYMGLPPAIVGIDRGVPIKCVAGGHVNGTIMVAKKEYKHLSDLDKNLYEIFAQFKGKTIGTPSKGSIHDAILNYYLEKYELKDLITVKNYKQAEFIALDMKRGLVEAGVGTPALAVFALTLLDSHLILPPDELLPNNPSYGIFFHENIIEENPDIIITFLKHHKKASQMLRESPSDAAKKIAKTFTILNRNQNYVESVLEISPKYCISLSEGYLNSTQGFVNTLFNLGYINKKLETEDIFNFNFIKKVHPEKNHYSTLLGDEILTQ